MSYSSMPPGPPPFPQAPPPPPPQALAPVLVAIDPPAPQSRLTVLVRMLLFIPHYIVLAALGLAAYVVTIIGWFAALFTGQLPGFAAEFLTGYLRWQTRAVAYLYLLTGIYPPFTLEDAPYPIRVAVLPGRLNRLAVFFRFILIIPAAIVITLAYLGAFTIVAFVTWIIVLIRGGMPAGLHQALSAVLRYGTRVMGYELMLTSAYPGGLFGDQPGTAYAPPAFPAAPGFPPVPGYQPAPGYQPPTGFPPAGGPAQPAPGFPPPPGTEQPAFPAEPASPAEPDFIQAGDPFDSPDPGYGQPPAGPAGYGPPPATPGFPAPPGFPPPPGAPVPGPVSGFVSGFGPPADPWRLVLSSSARTLVGCFLGIGVLVLGGGIASDAALVTNVVSKAQAYNQVQAAITPVTKAEDSAASSLQACGSNLSCVTKIDAQLAGAYTTFASKLPSIGMPNSQDSALAAQTATDANKVGAVYASLGKATSATQYETIATASSTTSAVNALKNDLTNLGNALSG